MENKKFDVIIVGGSYSGLAAAMTLGRSNRRTLVIDSGKPCNRFTPHSQNFLTRDGDAPAEIAAVAKSQVAKYPAVSFLDDLAISGQQIEAGFLIETASGQQFQASKLVFATGIKDLLTLATQEEEHRHIAESLHNGLGQMLYCIKVSLAGLSAEAASGGSDKYEQKRRYTSELLSEAIRDTRRISHELMPSVPDEFGLDAAVKEICQQIKGRVIFNCSVNLGEIRLEKYIELAIFRILQELMMNVVHHEEASMATVRVKAQKQSIDLQVTDNGKGKWVEKQGKDSIGLASIRSKVKLLNEEMQITSDAATGMEVSISLPLSVWSDNNR